ncbi:hypothetical protein TSOC_010834 [Tetrabaena socialis]|uniref:Uncharacterized protein n=1 Tax=Tetrabaena socialis TaxID=47790 RepID=A0A2J7ZS93_9CHLO|nr:hypothetical protein TSOC_010834 [Tetrabaena socialis]|eukprot:PNH03128.1 hypothetical protein TSOC_010834 [Tetrabaena socialis]
MAASLLRAETGSITSTSYSSLLSRGQLVQWKTSAPRSCGCATARRAPLPLRAVDHDPTPTGSAGAPASPEPSGAPTTATDGPPAASTSAGTAPAPAPAPAAAAPAPADPDALAAAELGSIWEKLKEEMRKDLGPEERQVLESIKVDDLVGDRGDLMRKVAEEQLGPVLRTLGVEEDPLTFFVDLLRVATALQLGSAAVLFYGSEVWGGLDTGEAFRCVAGLGAGYLSRPLFRVEQLLWPVYDWVLRLVAPGAVYQVVSSPSETQATLSRLGVAVAVCSFLPQLLWGWDSGTCAQFVLPLASGWLLFDVMYMTALLAKLR